MPRSVGNAVEPVWRASLDHLELRYFWWMARQSLIRQYCLASLGLVRIYPLAPLLVPGSHAKA